MKSFLPLAALAVLLAGCGEEQSATLKQAIAVHDEVVRLSSELHASLVVELGQTTEEIEAAWAAGDTALAQQLQQLEARLSAIDLRFHDFSETVVEVPGHVHDHSHHAHDHSGHDHGDHNHGDHDHGDHDHNHHHGGPSLEGMSDEAILEIQQALKSEIEAIRAELQAVASEE